MNLLKKISGYTKDDLIGKSHNIVRHKDTPDKIFKELWETINNKKTWSGIIKNRKKNGDFYIVDTIIKPILDINGEIEEFVALRNDITDLENSKEYFRKRTVKATTNLKESIKKSRSIQKCN